jgi:hypothetical protein
MKMVPNCVKTHERIRDIFNGKSHFWFLCAVCLFSDLFKKILCSSQMWDFGITAHPIILIYLLSGPVNLTPVGTGTPFFEPAPDS